MNIICIKLPQFSKRFHGYRIKEYLAMEAKQRKEFLPMTTNMDVCK